jgi:putative oxidoreductase
MDRYLNLAGRILLALILIISGYGKIVGYVGTQVYMSSKGVSGAMLPLVILLELGGSAAIIVGFMTRWVSLVLALFFIVSAILFHMDFGNQVQIVYFMKNLAMGGGFFLLAQAGASYFSIDAARSGGKR